MSPLQRQASALPGAAMPAASTAASGRDRGCRTHSSGSRRFPESHVGWTPGRKRRVPTPSYSAETAAPSVGGGAASTTTQRRVQNMQMKHFDPVTGRFVFLSFAQQLQQQLQHHVSPLHRTSALDLLEQQQILLRHSVGCAGVRRLNSADDGDSRGKLQSLSDLDYSAFRAVLQEYMFARNPPFLTALLAELQPLSSTLPLLLLEKDRVVQLLLSHILHEDCCTVVLALFPALAKDLRTELVPYLPSIFSTLLLVLQQLEAAADAECLKRLFGCVTNLFRYLAKPLLKDFRVFLDLYLPWLCGTVAAAGRASPCSETNDQAQECHNARERVLPSPAGADLSPEKEPEWSSSLAGAADAKVAKRTAPKKKRPMSKSTPRLPEVLAAQAFACLLRKAAADEDGGALLHCAEELMLCFGRCSPAAWPVLAETFGRVLFETVRSFQQTLSSSFDPLLRFLLATVLFQKPYKDVINGVEYSPTAACHSAIETLRVLHPTLDEEDIRSGGILPEKKKEVAVTRESKRRRRMGAEERDLKERTVAEDIPTAEPLCEKEASGQTAEHSDQSDLREDSVASDVCQDIPNREHLRTNAEEIARIPDASCSEGKDTSCTCPYFYQVKCLETLMNLVRLHAGSMQSKAALEVQRLLLEFVAAALSASSVSIKDCITSSEKVKAGASGSEYNLMTTVRALRRDACGTRVSGNSACDDGDSRSHSVCRSECQERESLLFEEFLHSSFLPYFYERPSPRPLSSHPYFRSCGAWLFALESDISTFLREESAADGVWDKSSFAITATHPLSAASAKAKNIFFSGFGLLTLLEFVGDWFTAIPRLQGNVDAFAAQLLRILAPYALPGNSGERPALNRNQTIDGLKTAVDNTPPILHPLTGLLHLIPTTSSSHCAVVRGMKGRQKDGPEVLRLREATAVFAVTLPCALLRLIAVTWRATPKSFVAAISTVAPDLLRSLLLSPQKWERLRCAACQQGVICNANLQDQCRQNLHLTGRFYSRDCWGRRLTDVYLDCCIAFISLLQHPELLSTEPETCTNRAHGFVEGFSAHALRPTFDFLVMCFCDQLPGVSFLNPSPQTSSFSLAASPCDAAAEFISMHAVDESGRYVIPWSHWRRSACGVLLAEQLHNFSELLRSERTCWNTDALCRVLNVLTVAFDELISQCDTVGVGTPAHITRQHEEARIELLTYAWGLMTWAKPLTACLSTPSANESRSKTAGSLLQAKSDEERLLHACREFRARLIKFIFHAIIWIVGGLTGSLGYEDKGEINCELTEWNEEKAAISLTEARERYNAISGQSNINKTFDESRTKANHTDEKSPVMYFQVVRQCLDCLFALAAGGRFFSEGISIPTPNISHITWLLQRLAKVHAPQEGENREKGLKASTANYKFEGGVATVSLCHRTEATTKGHLVACNILNLLLNDDKVSVVSSESSTDGVESTCAGCVATVEVLRSSIVEGTQRNGSDSDAASAAAKWVVLLLSVFNAMSSTSSRSSTKPFLLPLLQCSRDCLQAFVQKAQSQACRTAESGAVLGDENSSSISDIAAEIFVQDSDGSVMESILTPADSALGHNITLVMAAVNASLPALLASLSSPCRSLRLTVGRFLSVCNAACRLLVPRGAASGSRKSMSTSSFFAALNSSGRMLVDGGANVFLINCRELFQLIVDLESTQVDLSEERRLTRLVEQIGRSVLSLLSLLQEEDQRFWSFLLGLGNDDSRETCSSSQKRYTSPVLLSVECAVRVLVAQFSVRFTPVWQAAVDALVELAEQAATADKRGWRSFGSSVEDAGGVKAARVTDTSVMREGRGREQLTSVPTDRCVMLLPTMWRIITREVHRAEDALDYRHALAHCDDKQGARVQQHERQKQYVKDRVHGRVVEHGISSSVSSNSTTLDRREPRSTSLTDVGRRSGSRAVVVTAWHQAGAELADCRDPLEHESQESDPLSRHTQLLRVIENINRITFSDADVSGSLETIPSPKPPEECKYLPRSVLKRNDQMFTEELDDETHEESGKKWEARYSASRAEVPYTTLHENTKDSSKVAQSAESATRRGVTIADHANQFCLLRRTEGLKRTCWILSEALRLVGALTDDASEEWSCGAADRAHADGTRRQKAQQGEDVLVAALGTTPSHTSRVSLVPRTCNVLRAVVALGTTHTTRLSPRALSQRVVAGSLDSRREVSQTDNIHSAMESEDYACLAESVSRLWNRLLECCAQRLITIADPTLQQLSIKVLQLSPALRSRLQPYALLLDQLTINKSVSDLLLRLRLMDNYQQDVELKLRDDMRADEDEDEERKKLAEARDVVSCDKADAAVQSDIVILREHKDLVLPLLVRLLLTKVQQRATKRSSTTSFSLRRSILSFISSVAVEELPLVLAVLLHPLTCARKISNPLWPEYSKDYCAVKVRDRDTAEKRHQPATSDPTNGIVPCSSRHVAGRSSVTNVFSSEAGLPGSPTPAAGKVISGFDKEEALRRVVLESTCLRQVSQAEDGLIDQAHHHSREPAHDRQFISVPPNIEAATVKRADTCSRSVVSELAVVIAETKLPEDDSLVAITLAPACLPPRPLTRLRGCLETLKHLQELIGKLLRPAAPFLVQFYCTLLQQLAVRRTLPQARCDVDSAATEACTSSELKSNAAEAILPAGSSNTNSKSIFQKAVVHSTLLLLKQLLHLFPDEAATWHKLLRPAGGVLQQLLDAAIETAAASPVYGSGSGKNSTQEKKSIPAIVSLVTSWATQPAYYGFFTTLLPNALTALFRVPAAPAVLRAVCLRDRMVHKSSFFCGRNLGVLDAAIDVALQLSCGSSAEGQDQHIEGLSHGSRRWRSHHCNRKERTRDRRTHGYESESSSDAEDSKEENEDLPNASASALIRQNAEVWELEQQELSRAAQYQREGMTILRPYLPGLLRSLEIMFQHRSKPVQGVTGVAVSRSLQLTSSHTGVTSHYEDSVGGARRDMSRGKTDDQDEGSLNVVLRVKELQLLTRIAQYTADKHEEVQHLSGAPEAVATQHGDVYADTATPVAPEEENLTCSLVRLLLQCLWSCSSGRRDARHAGAVRDLRRVLTLQALRRLTLPLAMRIRALRYKEVCDGRQRRSTVLPECGEATAGEVISGTIQRTREEPRFGITWGSVGGYSYASDASVDALRLTVRSCSRLLQEGRSMQCRVATAELLLAAELAACGLSHSDKLFSDIREEVSVFLHRSEGDEINRLRTFDGDAEIGETSSGLPAGNAVLDALLPDGIVFKTFLERAIALSREKQRGDDLNEGTCQRQEAPTETTASEAKLASTCGELKQLQPHPEGNHCISSSSPLVVSVLAEHRRQGNSRGFLDGSGGESSEQLSHLRALCSQEEELIIWTQWHLGMALVLLSLNAVKSYGKRLAFHSTVGDEEEMPDSDTQIIILSSLAERCIDIQVPRRVRPPSALETEMCVESCAPAEEDVGTDTYALLAFNRSALTASAAEPLVRQCLYLLSSPVVEWSVQQVALNIIKRLIDAVVSCATQYSSALKSHCSSSSGGATCSLTWYSTATCPAVTAVPGESDSEGCCQSSRNQGEFIRLWQAVSSHASGNLSILEESVMPFAYLQLKQPDEDQWRLGVQIFEHVVRSFAPAAPLLVSLIVLSECGPSAATACPVADTHKRLTRLQRVFCLDLACLLLQTPATPRAQRSLIGALPSEKVDRTATGTEAVQAMVSAASSRNAGGDFFIDLLHVQRHRRGRALQRMAAAVEAGLLSRNTLQTVGLPLSLGALLQRESCATKKQTQRRAKHRQLFHQGLCEQGLKCLVACCARIPWKRCLRVIQVLAGFLIRLPEREAYIYRGICGAVLAFEGHVRVARAEAGVIGTLTARSADSRLKNDLQPCQRRPRGHQETHSSTGGWTSTPLGASASKGRFVSPVEAAASPVPPEEEEEEEKNKEGFRDCNVFGLEGSLTEPLSEGQLLGHSPRAVSLSRLERLQACIRIELLPLLFRLAFRKRQTKLANSSSVGGLNTCSGGRPSHEHDRGKDEDAKEMNPRFVVICILLLRLLPSAVFEEQLPRLVRMVALRLRSRDRDVRRQARGALVSVAVQLGSRFLPFLVTEVSAIMRSTTTKGNGSHDDKGAAPTGPQAFLNSVLLFTLHAIIHHVVHPHHVQGSQASDQSCTILLHSDETTLSSGGVTTNICRSSKMSVTGKPSSIADKELAVGFLDEAFPILLPLVAEELFRTCDSDRPFDTALKTETQNAKHDEAKHMKGAAMIFLLSSVCSPAACEELLIPFFSALLSGRELVCVWSGSDRKQCQSRRQQRMIIRQRQGFSSAAAFSTAYLERIRELFFHLAKGLNINAGLTVDFKLRLSRRLLVMAVSIMQQQCVHPLRQVRCRRKELLELALAQQHIELSTSRLANVPLQRANLGVRRASSCSHVSSSGTHPPIEAETSREGSIGDGQLSPPFMGSEEAVTNRRHTMSLSFYDEAVRQDMTFFRNVFLLASEQLFQGVPAGDSATTIRSEEKANCGRNDTTSFSELDTPSGTRLALRVADSDRREGLRLAVATRKHRTMLTQPGAAAGKSLEQATAAYRTAKGRGGGGFEDSSRAAAIGEAALRLLLLTLKKHKADLDDGVDRRVQKRLTAKPLNQDKCGESEDITGHKDTVLGEKTQCIDSFGELEKCVENVVCCLCSTDNELIAWSARCLIYMIGLKLREVNRLGCVISYSALKIFQMAGEVATGAQQKKQQVLLAPCTRLLTLLLLRPQASVWVDKALYGGRDIPRTQEEFLRQQMRKQAQHQVKAVRARQALLHRAPSGQTCSTENQSLSTLVYCHPDSEQQAHAAQNTDGRSDRNGTTLRQLVAGGFNGCDPYTQLQAHLLQAEQDELPVAAVDAKQQQVKFREALVAQITHSLERPQTRLSALMLFKSVVLPHYREVAAESLREKGEGNSKDEPEKKSKFRADQSTDTAPRDKGNLAGCWLLREVYRCVDVIARLMIQEAGDIGENKRLAELSADVYVHFLMNFPMTVKAQQRKVLFLIKNLGYSTVDGRRAVLNCIHKILSRFPYELTMEKYSDVMMVSLCRRLVLEDDPVTHSMLRMLVGQIMQISEDLQDGRHTALNVLRSCVEVLLQPKVTNLLAVEELLLVFVDMQAALHEQNVARRVLPFLHRTLELSEVAHDAVAAESINVGTSAVSCCKHGCCGGVDWRVCYKALLIFEKLMLCTAPLELDSLLAKTVTALQQMCRSSDFIHDRLGTSTNAPGQSVRLVKLLYDCRYPATDDAHYQMTLANKETAARTDEMSNIAYGPRIASAQNLEAQRGEITSVKTALRLDSSDAASAFALARLWHLTAGAGIVHRHPWIRAVSLRCVGIYLGAKLHTGFNQNVPSLFCLPLDDLSLSRGSGIAVSESSEDRLRHSTAMQVNEQIGRRQECASFLERNPQTAITERDKETSCYTIPGVKIFLGALKSLGADEYLERSPQAVPAVYALLLPLLKLAAERPELFPFTRIGIAKASIWQPESKEQATVVFTDNTVVKKDADFGCERDCFSSVQADFPDHLDDPQTFSVRRRPLKETPCTTVLHISTEVERTSSWDGAHPLVLVLRKICFWLRLHLGSLGKRDLYKSSCGLIRKRSAVEADASSNHSSITRVGAILSVLHCILYILPLRGSYTGKDSAGKGELPAHPERKKKLKVEESHQPQNVLVPGDDSLNSYASLGRNSRDPSYDKEATCEVWIRRVILIILEALFRCSTLVRNDTSDQGSNSKAEHLVKMVAELQDHSIGQAGESFYTHTQQAKHRWEQLRALDPKDQQAEVVAAGAYLLDCFRVRMSAVGMEDTFLQLLAKARRKVLRQRMERKAQLRRQAVVQPERFAERRRKRQIKKTLVKSIAVMDKKWKGILRNSWI